MANRLSIAATVDGSQNDLIDMHLKISSGSVFIYFYATWCPDCTRSTPLVRNALANAPPSVTVIEVDVGPKAEFRNKDGALRSHLGRWELKCLPTLLCLSMGPAKANVKDVTTARADTELESCEDVVQGQAIADAFVASCLPAPTFLQQHGIKASMAVLAAGVTLMLLKKGR